LNFMANIINPVVILDLMFYAGSNTTAVMANR
jgi:hypothetical protein